MKNKRTREQAMKAEQTARALRQIERLNVLQTATTYLAKLGVK